jgi:hypothetical protein
MAFMSGAYNLERCNTSPKASTSATLSLQHSASLSETVAEVRSDCKGIGRPVLTQTKPHGLSPRANYTDRATAACRRSDCQLFADRECHVVRVTDPYGRILGFLDSSRYFSIK